jgi:radical SAM protein with 4Fe4S-binding SPASM domain
MTVFPTDYGPLLRDLQARAAVSRQPLNGLFELTERCNLRCSMCYVSRSAGDRVCRAEELSASEWLDLARQAVNNGMVFLLLTGGEVFLRRDFFEIYTPLTSMGLVLTLFTNGTLVTDAIAERLAQAPPSRTEVTIYGATKETYEMVTGVRGSYARCCAGIEALVKHSVPLGLKTTITRQNIAELDGMRAMAHNWGVPFTASWLLTKRRDKGFSGVENCRLSASECVALENADRATAEEWIETALREPSVGNDQNFSCQAGKSAFVISPSGTMNACVDLVFPAARPLEIGFGEAWEQVQEFIDYAPSLSTECIGCESRHYCSRCPAWSELETSTLTEPVPYLCSIANIRKDVFLRTED